MPLCLQEHLWKLNIHVFVFVYLCVSVCHCGSATVYEWGSEDKLWEWVHPLLPYGVQGLNSGRLSALVASMQAHLATEPSHKPL